MISWPDNTVIEQAELYSARCLHEGCASPGPSEVGTRDEAIEWANQHTHDNAS